MMLKIALATSLGGQAVQASQPVLPPAPSPTLGIVDFTRDQQIFDSDAARGNDAAVIAVRGQSNAPEGTAIEVRAVSVDDGGATSTAFASVGTAGADGAWSGTIRVPRSASWYRAEARIAGAPASAVRTANRFGVGLVILFSQQSNGVRLFQTGDGVFETIGNQAGDFQYFQHDNSDDPNSTITGPVAVHDGDRRFPGIASMAAAFARNAPGLKVAGLFDIRVGVSQHETLDDSATRRHFTNINRLVGTALPDGGDVGLFMLNHRTNMIAPDPFVAEYYSNALFGARLDGTPIAGMSPAPGGFGNVAVSYGGATARFNHVWAEALPGLLTGRTQALLADDMYGGSEVDAAAAGSDEEWRRQRQIFVAAWPTRSKVAVYAGAVRHGDTANFDDNHHFATWHETGGRYFAAKLAVQYLHAAGILSFAPPRFDVIEWTASYLRLHSDAGPITTLRRAQGGTTNFPVDANASPQVPSGREVMGFQLPDFSEPARVEIRIPNADGSPGPSAAAGDIYIYPDSGGFTALNRMYFNRGQGNGLQGWTAAMKAGVVEHHAIVDVGLKGQLLQHGWHVQPFDPVRPGYPDGLETLNTANKIPGGDVVTSVSSPAINAGTGLKPGPYRPLTFEARFARDAPARFTILQFGTGSTHYGLFRVEADHSVVFYLKSHSGTNITPVITSAAGVFDNVNTVRTVRVTYAETGTTQATINLYIDGVLANSGGFGPGVTVVPSYNDRTINLFPGGAGQVAWFKLWRGEALVPGTAEGTPFVRRIANGAGGFSN